MKTTLATAIAIVMMFGTVYAGGPGDPRPGTTPAPPTLPAPPAPAPPAPAPTPRPGTSTPGGTTAPAPDQVKNPKDKKGNNGANHGKKKGWNKNPNNPHHPQSTNPGHAKNK